MLIYVLRWWPSWISDRHKKHKSGRGPSNEHVWQVWLKSVLQFQRRRVKCEKLTDGRRTLTHDKSSHGLLKVIFYDKNVLLCHFYKHIMKCLKRKYWVFMFQLQLFFFAPLWPQCSSAETQVCHRSYIIAARLVLIGNYKKKILLTLSLFVSAIKCLTLKS
jgi:hypothetical protein